MKAPASNAASAARAIVPLLVDVNFCTSSTAVTSYESLGESHDARRRVGGKTRGRGGRSERPHIFDEVAPDVGELRGATAGREGLVRARARAARAAVPAR